MTRPNFWLAFAATAALATAACSGNGSGDPAENNNGGTENNASNNGKGDTPKLESQVACDLRNDDVLRTGKPRFLPDFVRWPAGDVEGVNTEGRDSRGQEYTEYFAVLTLPSEDGSALAETGQVFGVPGKSPLGVELNDDQLFYLEDNGDAEVGSCIFTSWHADIPGPLPACNEGACPTVHGVEMTEDMFRMQIGFNSNAAASDLVQKCYSRAQSGAYGPDNNFENEFMRGCMMVADIFGTEWRSSDPQVCAAAMRLSECGCFVTGAPDADLGFALVPSLAQQMEASNGITLRGFRLGTWDDPEGLPPGCEYIDVGVETNGVDGHNFVKCSVTGSDLLANQADPKEFCRQKYGPDVVVHVPVPAAALSCEPPKEGMFAHTCGDTPWVVTQTADTDVRAECCKVCEIGLACGDTCIDASENCTVGPGCACQ